MGRSPGTQVLCPGPGHSQKDRSLAVRPTTSGFVVFSHAGDDWRRCKNHVHYALGIDARKIAHERVPRFAASSESDLVQRQNRARHLWRSRRPIQNSLAEVYLRARGTSLTKPSICGRRKMRSTQFGSTWPHSAGIASRGLTDGFQPTSAPMRAGTSIGLE